MAHNIFTPNLVFIGAAVCHILMKEGASIWHLWTIEFITFVTTIFTFVVFYYICNHGFSYLWYIFFTFVTTILTFVTVITFVTAVITFVTHFSHLWPFSHLTVLHRPLDICNGVVPSDHPLWYPWQLKMYLHIRKQNKRYAKIHAKVYI